MPSLQKILLLIAVLSTLAMPAMGATIQVPGDAATIQGGIDLATAGDIVEVACGTYFEDSLLMKEGVTLRSETGEASCVTLQGEGGTAIWVDNLDYCRIQGFTFTGFSTAALRLVHANPFIENCHFEDNSHTDGGAIHMLGSEPTILNCTFLNNSASHAGGAIAMGDSAPTILDCQFVNNWANFGGALDVESWSALTMDSCVVEMNSAAHAGGGLFVWINLGPATITVTNSKVRYNQSSQGADGWAGLACYMALIGCSMSSGFNDTFDGPGTIFIDNIVPTTACSWGKVKTLYR